jgi:hypothetical protein
LVAVAVKFTLPVPSELTTAFSTRLVGAEDAGVLSSFLQLDAVKKENSSNRKDEFFK